MNRFVLSLMVAWGILIPSLRAQIPQVTNAFSNEASTQDAPRASIPDLLAKWRAEKDPRTRRELGGQLLAAMIEFDDNGNTRFDAAIADEVSRDGTTKHELKPSGTPVVVHLIGAKFLSKTGTPKPDSDMPVNPVFRRVSANMVEAWAPAEGWLFDGEGKLVSDAHVRRHEGYGAAWLGAFLPDGRWITTDLWTNDHQLYAFSKDSKLLWDLQGKTITARLPPPKWGAGTNNSEDVITPSIAWARADNTSKQWLVCLGQDYSRGFALINPEEKIQPLAADANVWAQTYPRSMGTRGGYVEVMIPSDDGKKVMTQTQPAHGAWCGWTGYIVSDWGKPEFDDPRDYSTTNNTVLN